MRSRTLTYRAQTNLLPLHIGWVLRNAHTGSGLPNTKQISEHEIFPPLGCAKSHAPFPLVWVFGHAAKLVCAHRSGPQAPYPTIPLVLGTIQNLR